MKKRRVLFIGLGWEQRDLARRLRREGHAVRGVAPGSIPAVLEAARRFKADRVVSDQCDYSRYAEETASAVLGLPTRAAGSAAGVSKHLQRSLAQGKVPQPAWAACHDVASALAAFKRLGRDVMVKPSDARGSLGVARVRRASGVKAAYYGARRNGLMGPVIVERFTPGELVTLDGVVTKGRFELKAVSRSTHSVGAAVRLEQHVYYHPEDQAKIARAGAPLVSRLCEAFGMNEGFIHSEWLWDGSLTFVELANRAPGIRAVSRMIEPLCGEDLYARVYPELLRPRPVRPARYFVQQFHFGPISRAGRPFLSPAARRSPALADVLSWPYKNDGTGRTVRLGHVTFGGEDLPALKKLARTCGAKAR